MFQFSGKPSKLQNGLKKSKESWFRKIVQIMNYHGIEEGLWEELEELLISSDVGVATTYSLIENVKNKAKAQGVTDSHGVVQLLKLEILSIFSDSTSQDHHVNHLVDDKPMVILVVGVNGVGKTTSIAKLSGYFRENGNTVLLAASDTFRAAAIDQIQAWALKLNVDVIAHERSGDPAAIAYDALEAAQARGIDVVLIDTAGRFHTSTNLMEEVKKISRVLSKLDPNAPHQIIFTLDATTGQNGLAQARIFSESLGCTGVFLSKLDGSSKGGIVIPIVKELGLPVLFVGTGESLEDIAPFAARDFVEELFSPLD